jgi:hypothetical protein
MIKLIIKFIIDLLIATQFIIEILDYNMLIKDSYKLLMKFTH